MPQIWGFRSSGYSLPIVQSTRRAIVSRPSYYHTKALRSVPNADTVVATDDNYGHKEVISVNPRLYDYLLVNVREPKVLLADIACALRGNFYNAWQPNADKYCSVEQLGGINIQKYPLIKRSCLQCLFRFWEQKGVLKLVSTLYDSLDSFLFS